MRASTMRLGGSALLLAAMAAAAADAAARDPLRDWMRSLRIPLPGNVSGEMPMDMGVFQLNRGYCKGLTVEEISSHDLSNGLVLEFNVEASQLGIFCHVEGYSDGPINIDITLAGSSLNASVQIHPYYGDMAPDLPLPMGTINVTSCTADLQVVNMTWAGSGYLFDTLDLFGDDVIPLVGMFVNDPLCDGLKSFLEENGTAALQTAAVYAQMMLEPPLPMLEPEALEPVLDWDKFPPVRVAQALLSERFPLWAGRVIQIFDGAQINREVLATENGGLTLVDLNIEGTGGHEGPGLGVIAEGSRVGVSANLTGMTINALLAFSVTLSDQPKYNHHVNVTLGLQEVSMVVRAMVDEARLNKLHIDEAMHSPACIIQCTEGTTEPQSDSVDFETFNVELRPLLQMHSFGALEHESSKLVNTIVAALYGSYLPTVNALVNGVLALARDPLDALLWDKLSEFPTCSREDLFYVLSEKAIMGLWLTAVLLALVGIPVAVIAQCLNGGRSGGRGQAEASQPSGGSEVAVQEPRALCCESFVPKGLAMYYPFAVLSVMFLFAYADLDLGATVSMVMTAEGKSSTLGPMFAFSLVSTVAHCWSSQAYFIAVLTILASGVWPFVKLTSLLIVWLVPPKLYSLKVRGQVLRFLDNWGKYSFLDSWFLVVTLSAFAVDWESAGDASMKIQTTPAPAFYAFFAATVFSLVLGHVASECHQHSISQQMTVEESGSKRQVVSHQERESLCSFAASRVERIAIVVCIVLTLILSFGSVFMDSFSFKVSGVFPQFLFGRETEEFYSVFSVGLATAKGRWDETGLLGLEVAFVLLSIIVPFVLLLMLLAMWTLPANLEGQRTLLHACRMLDAWACLDVSVLVLVIACFEFGRLAEFLVYEGNFAAPCNMVKDLTKDECMKIELHGHPVLGLLFITGALLAVGPKVCMHLSTMAIQRRAESPADSGKMGDVPQMKDEGVQNRA